jgi:protein Mpv17
VITCSDETEQGKCVSCRLLPLWLLSNVLWPAAHAINFRYVPTEQRVLFVNAVSLIWNTITCQVALF